MDCDMSTTLKLTITNYEEISERKITFAFGDLLVTAASGITLPNAWNTQYVVPPTMTDLTLSNLTATFADGAKNVTVSVGTPTDIDEDDKTEIVLTITYTFGWGSEFNHMNPYTYYNGINPVNTTTIKAQANTALGELAKLNNATYAMTITGKTQ